MAVVDCSVEYRDIPGFLGYRVGDDGSVWSEWHSHGYRCGKWKRLKPGISGRDYLKGKGYYFVNLRANMIPKITYVHRLVLTVFISPCPNGMVACHNNGNSLDNRLANLRWDTPKGNKQDDLKHGKRNSGERCGASKFTNEIVAKVRSMHSSGIPITDIGKAFGMRRENVWNIVTRRTWKHLA